MSTYLLRVGVSKMARHMSDCCLALQKTTVAGDITLQRHEKTMQGYGKVEATQSGQRSGLPPEFEKRINYSQLPWCQPASRISLAADFFSSLVEISTLPPQTEHLYHTP